MKKIWLYQIIFLCLVISSFCWSIYGGWRALGLLAQAQLATSQETLRSSAYALSRDLALAEEKLVENFREWTLDPEIRRQTQIIKDNRVNGANWARLPLSLQKRLTLATLRLQDRLAFFKKTYLSSADSLALWQVNGELLAADTAPKSGGRLTLEFKPKLTEFKGSSANTPLVYREWQSVKQTFYQIFFLPLWLNAGSPKEELWGFLQVKVQLKQLPALAPPSGEAELAVQTFLLVDQQPFFLERTLSEGVLKTLNAGLPADGLFKPFLWQAKAATLKTLIFKRKLALGPWLLDKEQIGVWALPVKLALGESPRKGASVWGVVYLDVTPLYQRILQRQIQWFLLMSLLLGLIVVGFFWLERTLLKWFNDSNVEPKTVTAPAVVYQVEAPQEHRVAPLEIVSKAKLPQQERGELSLPAAPPPSTPYVLGDLLDGPRQVGELQLLGSDSSLKEANGSLLAVAPTPAAVVATLNADLTQVKSLSDLGAVMAGELGVNEVPEGVPENLSGEEKYFRQIFAEFVALRQKCGESGILSFNKFRGRLKQTETDLKTKYQCEEVKFQVYVKDGRAALKSLPIASH